MLTTQLARELTDQTCRDLFKVFRVLVRMADWCSVSLPDANARVTAATIETNLSILVQDLSAPDRTKTPADVADWLAIERDQIKSRIAAKVESLISRIVLNCIAVAFDEIIQCYRHLAAGNGETFSYHISHLATNLELAADKMTSVPLEQLVAANLLIPTTARAEPTQQHFAINMPSQPLDLTIHSPSVDVTVNPQLTTAPSKITRDASGKMIGIEPV